MIDSDDDEDTDVLKFVIRYFTSLYNFVLEKVIFKISALAKILQMPSSYKGLLPIKAFL